MPDPDPDSMNPDPQHWFLRNKLSKVLTTIEFLSTLKVKTTENFAPYFKPEAVYSNF
jgi:hypothetical protein